MTERKGSSQIRKIFSSIFSKIPIMSLIEMFCFKNEPMKAANKWKVTNERHGNSILKITPAICITLHHINDFLVV